MNRTGLISFIALVAVQFCMAQDAKTIAESSSQPAAVATPPAATRTTPPHVDKNYVIGPFDVLTVNVWKEQALSGNLLVRPDGMISMSLIGDIKASDQTPLQLANQIEAKLT